MSEIQRYDPEPGCGMEIDPEGPFVRYEDHNHLLSQEREKRETARAAFDRVINSHVKWREQEEQRAEQAEAERDEYKANWIARAKQSDRNCAEKLTAEAALKQERERVEAALAAEEAEAEGVRADSRYHEHERREARAALSSLRAVRRALATPQTPSSDTGEGA